MEEIKKMFDEFLVDYEKAKNGNRAAGVRARVQSLHIAEALKTFRKESMSWSKEK